tara:strand:+ start:1018 stop:1380 length:363 start_codon:yes stop_codon:yes gene_type:complete
MKTKMIEIANDLFHSWKWDGNADIISSDDEWDYRINWANRDGTLEEGEKPELFLIITKEKGTILWKSNIRKCSPNKKFVSYIPIEDETYSTEFLKKCKDDIEYFYSVYFIDENGESTEIQ